VAREVVMVNGLPGSGKSTLGPRLAGGLGAAFLSKDQVKETLAGTVANLGAVAMETVYGLAASLDGTVVLDSWWFRPRDLGYARDGLARSGATASVEVWCDVPPSLARLRVAERQRPAFYQDARRLAEDWDGWVSAAAPLALGPVIRVDTSRPVDVARLCAEVKAALRA
jgi:predicted kinase